MLAPETAAAFHAAANINQLTMMLNKATLAFQSQDFVTAGALVKWLIEVTPCDTSSASADDVTRCFNQVSGCGHQPVRRLRHGVSRLKPGADTPQ